MVGDTETSAVELKVFVAGLIHGGGGEVPLTNAETEVPHETIRVVCTKERGEGLGDLFAVVGEEKSEIGSAA